MLNRAIIQSTPSTMFLLKFEGLRQVIEQALSGKAKGDLFIRRTTAIVRILHSGREVLLTRQT